MLDKLSMSLKNYIKNCLGDNSLKIVLRQPTEDYKPEEDTINLYLYDLYENLELRASQSRMDIDYRNGTAMIEKPPLRLSCSYLVSVWPGKNGNYGNEEEKLQREHELLGYMTTVAAGSPVIPYEYLKDNHITYDQLPLPTMSLQRDANLKPTEIWSALKCPIKPSFTLTVTICIPNIGPKEVYNLFTKLAGSFQDGGQADKEDRLQFACMVKSDEETVPYAAIEICELNRISITDEKGIGTFTDIKEGTYKLNTYATGYTPCLDKTISVTKHTKDDFIINLLKHE